MNVEVVTIGDELLLGFTVDTNAARRYPGSSCSGSQTSSGVNATRPTVSQFGRFTPSESPRVRPAS